MHKYSECALLAIVGVVFSPNELIPTAFNRSLCTYIFTKKFLVMQHEAATHEARIENIIIQLSED